VAYLLNGNARVRLAYVNQDFSDLALALQDFEEAWKISGQTYGRALISMGGVAFLQAFTDPNSASDPNYTQQKLDEAEALFKQAKQLPDQEPSYNIPEKVALSLGQLYQARGDLATQANQPDLAKQDYQQAQDAYQQVVDSFLNGNKTASEVAMFAYARLGLLATGFGDQQTYAGNLQAANDEYERAIAQYLKAYELAGAYFKSEYAASIGRLSYQQGINALDLTNPAAASEVFLRAQKYLQEGLRLAESLSRQQLIDEYQPDLDKLQQDYGQYLMTPTP
jgi:hypothetical protein